MYFILNDDGSVCKVSEKEDFLKFMDNQDKKELKRSSVYGICDVVTFFLGQEPQNIKRRKRSQPLLFETRVIGGPIDDSVRYYGSYDDGLKGHENVIGIIKKSIN